MLDRRRGTPSSLWSICFHTLNGYNSYFNRKDWLCKEDVNRRLFEYILNRVHSKEASNKQELNKRRFVWFVDLTCASKELTRKSQTTVSHCQRKSSTRPSPTGKIERWEFLSQRVYFLHHSYCLQSRNGNLFSIRIIHIICTNN